MAPAAKRPRSPSDDGNSNDSEIPSGRRNPPRRARTGDPIPEERFTEHTPGIRREWPSLRTGDVRRRDNPMYLTGAGPPAAAAGRIGANRPTEIRTDGHAQESAIGPPAASGKKIRVQRDRSRTEQNVRESTVGPPAAARKRTRAKRVKIHTDGYVRGSAGAPLGGPSEETQDKNVDAEALTTNATTSGRVLRSSAGETLVPSLENPTYWKGDVARVYNPMLTWNAGPPAAAAGRRQNGGSNNSSNDGKSAEKDA